MSEQPSQSEQRLYRELRDQLESLIAVAGLSDEELAQALGILPLGAQNLRARRFDDLSTCLRVAEALGIEAKLVVSGELNDITGAPLGPRQRLSSLAAHPESAPAG